MWGIFGYKPRFALNWQLLLFRTSRINPAIHNHAKVLFVSKSNRILTQKNRDLYKQFARAHHSELLTWYSRVRVCFLVNRCRYLENNFGYRKLIESIFMNVKEYSPARMTIGFALVKNFLKLHFPAKRRILKLNLPSYW